MKIKCICEDTFGSKMTRLLQRIKGVASFGPGVDPRLFGEVKEIINTEGLSNKSKEKIESYMARANEAANAGDHEKAYEILKVMADVNPLTGLRGKSYFIRSKTTEDRLFVVIDIDNLKYLNSKLGHKGADAVLIKFGELFEKFESAINNKFGNVCKVFHRSGDEFNVIINLTEANNRAQLIKFVIDQCNKLIKEFAAIEFNAEMGGETRKARATITAGIGFDENEIDGEVDASKNKRRRFSLTGEMPHLIISDEVKKFVHL